MLHQYRVTKYDPAHRNATGQYMIEDWTSRSEIGKKFRGTLLNERRYLDVEQAYVDSAIAFLQEAGVDSLRVVGLENPGDSESAPTDGSLLPLEEIAEVVRALLREDYWCKLESPAAFIHVGWDYYMYVGVPHRCPAAEKAAVRRCLFVESFQSPYLVQP